VSLDADGDRWCDHCWDNPATMTRIVDGRLQHLCEECERASWLERVAR
jgi:hypothetical protein